MKDVIGWIVALLLVTAVGLAIILTSGCGDALPLPAPDMGTTDGVVEPEADTLIYTVDPVQGCYDAASALATVLKGCTKSEEDAQKFYNGLVEGWQCATLTELKNSTTFYTLCLPALRQLSCIDLFSVNIPASCTGQFIK